MKERSPSSMDDSDIICFHFKNQNGDIGAKILVNSVCIYFFGLRTTCGGDCCIFVVLQSLWKMTSPQGMDNLFWGRDYENVSDWAERLTMATEVRDLTLDKLFKIAKLNLRG
jgi:hypothetical protein